MTIAPTERQHASARHYLRKPSEDTALQTAVTLIGEHFDFPMVQLNIVDQQQQHTIVAVGTGLDSLPRNESLCHQVVRDGVPKRITDLDPIPPTAGRFRAYIGVPITGREGVVVGALCLLDTVPREFGEHQMRQLVLAAAVVTDQLELLRRLQPTAAGNAEATRLIAAIDADEIIPHYQPIIDMNTGRIVGIEALARWRHPDLGWLPPSAFVPVAEDTDIIIDLDLAVLEQAVIDLTMFHGLQPGLWLSVNLSARHFQHRDCIPRLIGVVADAGVDPRWVSIEVTETAAFAGYGQDRDFLQDLRRAGFRIMLDDFGTGFSSLDHLLRLPIDGIKLDRSLTAALGAPAGIAISRALLTLASELGLNTVVEGVETAEQADAAHALGARFGQGHLWARALPADQLAEHLSDRMG